MLFQQYDKARKLLLAADGAIKDISYNSSRAIRLEILHVALQQYFETGMTTVKDDLIKQTKSCLTSLQLESGTSSLCIYYVRAEISPLTATWRGDARLVKRNSE